MLKTYAEFLASVGEYGVMVLSGKFLEGFPNLYDLTTPNQWHTGDAETDPWLWKDRAAAEKRLAFGSILGGRKGFVSPGLYPLFFSACRPDGSVEERYRRGYVKRTVYEVYALFEGGAVLDTSELRRRMNVRRSDGASAVDAAVTALQREYYISVCGSRRRTGADGREAGWPANTYCLAELWLSDWLREPLLPTREARSRLSAHLTGLDVVFDRRGMENILFGTL